MKSKVKTKQESGFTLAELVIAGSILVIAILTTAFCVLSLLDLSEFSKEKIVAAADTNRILEAMRDSANTSLTNLRNTNWAVWTAANVVNTKGANEPSLDQENAVAVVGAGNPAPVDVSLNWRHRRRTVSYQVITLMTDRN